MTARNQADRSASPFRFRRTGSPSRTRIVRGLVCGSAVAASLSGCASQPPPRRDVRELQVTDIEGYIEFVAREHERDQRSKVGGTNVTTKETILEESLGLELDGYAYHPNLFEFTLGGVFGLLQEDFEQQRDGVSASSNEDGSVLEFDLNGTFLKKKKYPGTVYARRHRSIEPRPFLPSLESTTTSYGLKWEYLDEKMPTSIELDHTETLFSSLGSSQQEGRQQSDSARFDTSYKFTKWNVLSFHYSRQSVQQEPFGFNYDSDSLTLSHRLQFGEGHKHQLSSELSYLDQRGTFNLERLQLRSRLELEHLFNLRSWYELEARDRTQGSLSGGDPIQEKSLFLSGAVEHRLYESLTSQINANVQRQEFEPDVTINRLAWSGSLDYRKKNPWGTLYSNYRFSMQQQERMGGAQRTDVVDEPHTFHDPDPIVLVGTAISTASILITDENAVTLFRPGGDYRIRTIADRVEIERVPTGRIADGQTVLIDYVLDQTGDFTLDTVGHVFGLRQAFRFGLTPYYRFRTQDQTLTPITDNGVTPEDITAHILGAEFNRWSLRLTAEYETQESSILPFDALRLSAGYSHKFNFGGTASAAVRWSDTQFDAPRQRSTEFFTVEGRYRHPLTPRLNVEGAVLYRTLQDTLSGDDEGVDVDLSLEYSVRQTTVLVTYEFGTFVDDFSDNEHSSLFVQVRRRF